MTLREAANRIEALEAANARHEAELRRLRRHKAAPDAESIEALLAHVRDEFQSDPWTAAMVLEAASENPMLIGAIKRCFGHTFSVLKLSRLLTQSVGLWGDLELRCLDSHSRDGARYAVTELLTRSQLQSDKFAQR
jgi:hypothetical protein